VDDEPALDLSVDPDVERHPLVAAAHELADELLAPQAAAVDGGSVPRSHLERLGAAGLLGTAAPAAAGGSAAPAPVQRRITEVLAGADLATWFVQAQHHFPVRTLAASGTHPELLADLAAGRTVAGIAFSHLRRWPDVPVAAVRAGGGWRLDGVAPWYTGWGLNDVALLAAATPGGEVLLCLLPAAEGQGLRASAPMRVAALQAAVTVRLTVEGVHVADADVVSRLRIEDWAAADRRVTVNVNPAVLGVAESALRLLAGHGRQRGEPAACAAAQRLAERWVDLRSAAYGLLDGDGDGGRGRDFERTVPERLRLRAEAGRLAVEAATALVIAGAGGAMAASSPAQRKAREALFLLVQAQTRDARTAALDAVGR
jgi:alkylation response protein AidB-like acyl-CoA dehydrogenase